MRYDEAMTYVVYASKGLATILVSYTAPNNHILHTVLVHYACALLGPSPWVTRLPCAGYLGHPAHVRLPPEPGDRCDASRRGWARRGSVPRLAAVAVWA